MKRITINLLVFSLIAVMAGCSNNADNEKSEESETKIESEQDTGETKEVFNEKTGKEIRQSDEESQEENNADIKNPDSVFEFVKLKYPQYSKDDFDKWTSKYMDITGDNSKEVIFTSTYGDGNLYCAIIITVEDGEYREISRYIPLAKYENKMTMQDGFLVHTSKSGGSGAYQKYMDLYVYGGHSLEVVKRGIKLDETVNSPIENFEITSNIKGSLKDFTITYIKENLDTKKEKIIAKDMYKYLGDYRMEKTPISLSNTAKPFDDVYNGSNLADTIKYFNKNLYDFGEDKRLNFVKKMFDVIKEDRSSFTERSEFIEPPLENFSKETLEYDITSLDEYNKEKFLKLKNNNMYSLVRTFFATEGSVTEEGFDVMMESWAYHMLKPAFEILHKQNPDAEFPFPKPDIYFNAGCTPIRKVTKTNIVYPNVLVESYDDAMALKGKDTWKTHILLRLKVVGNDSTNSGQSPSGCTSGEKTHVPTLSPLPCAKGLSRV